MPKLIISTDGVVVKEVQLTKDRSTLGRRPHNDVVIDNLAVSGQHAVFLIKDGQTIIEDLGSTNGTYVNGKAIKSQALKHDDDIEVGHYHIKFVQPTGHTAFSSATAGSTRISSPIGLDTQLSSPQMTSDGARIRVLSGNSTGRELKLLKDVTTVGKPGLSVASITKKGQGFELTHIEGEQITTINGEAGGTGSYTLTHHDVIELGGIRLEFLAH